MTRTTILRGSIPLVVLASVIAACGSDEPRPGERTGTFSEGDTKVCTTGTLLQGVDTSSGQGKVTWTSAKTAGVDWVIMKATQAADYHDSGFPLNWGPAKAAGVARGAYHFFDPTVDGVTQANYFLATMGHLDAEDLSPTLDVECPTGTDTCLGYAGGSGKTTAATFRANMLGWLTTVEAATGRKPIIYTYASFFAGTGAAGTGTAVDTTGFDAYPLWIADYSGTACFIAPSPWNRAAAWQYNSNGSFTGISGQVDIDHMVGPIDELLGWPAPKRSVHADVNGDGRADLCGRDPSGVTCAIATGSGFGAPFSGPAWSDASGWRPAAYASTVQLADVNGDGMADVCGRAAAGITCALSTGTGFGAPFSGPLWSDTANDAGVGGGWNAPEYYATIEFPDVNGDGKADACARASTGITCAISTGTGFGAPFAGPAWSDAAGWSTPSRYRTIRFADIDGDGKADVCGRSSDGLHCALSTGTGFGPDIAGPAWSDASGWTAAAYASTIQFPDVNGDGKADVCARAAAGITCALSSGTAFGTPFEGPAWSDGAGATADAGDAGSEGWNLPAYYATIVFLDANGDGKADVCGRSSTGMQCALSTGTAFGALFDGPAWSDAEGWDQARYYGTIGAGDVNGDGKDDLCARAAAGITCAPSTGTAFGAAITGPTWSDAVWGVAPYWATASVVGRARAGVTGDGGTGPGDGGSPAPADAGVTDGEGGPGIEAPQEASVAPSHGCGCRVGSERVGSAGGGAAWLGLALAVARRRRRIRSSGTARASRA